MLASYVRSVRDRRNRTRMEPRSMDDGPVPTPPPAAQYARHAVGAREHPRARARPQQHTRGQRVGLAHGAHARALRTSRAVRPNARPRCVGRRTLALPTAESSSRYAAGTYAKRGVARANRALDSNALLSQRSSRPPCSPMWPSHRSATLRNVLGRSTLRTSPASLPRAHSDHEDTWRGTRLPARRQGSDRVQRPRASPRPPRHEARNRRQPPSPSRGRPGSATSRCSGWFATCRGSPLVCGAKSAIRPSAKSYYIETRYGPRGGFEPGKTPCSPPRTPVCPHENPVCG